MAKMMVSRRVYYRTSGRSTPWFKGRIRSFAVDAFIAAEATQEGAKILLRRANGIQARYALDTVDELYQALRGQEDGYGSNQPTT